jgi:hypothetical protein
MRFNELAWAGFCFYYRSGGDKRYSAIMSDREFLSQIRNHPERIRLNEFEEKAILGYINIQNFDLLLKHKLTENILTKLTSLKREISFLQDLSLAECNLEEEELVDAVNRIYSELQVDGLWITGASKIAHLLNDRLLPPISLDIARHFEINYRADITPWLKRMQWDIQEAVDDFNQQAYEGTPSRYLSEKLGYQICGYDKSLVKFADEYYWLVYGDRLPIPPKWVPAAAPEKLPINKQKN